MDKSLSEEDLKLSANEFESLQESTKKIGDIFEPAIDELLTKFQESKFPKYWESSNDVYY